jgi:hypothetical protein
MSEPSEAMIDAGASAFAKAAWQIPRARPAAAAQIIYTAMQAARPVGDEQLLREALEEARAVISALLVVEEVARKIVETFEKDEAQGYRSSARTYVLDMLRPALGRRPLVDPTA